MSSFILKIIAVISMLFDHTGYLIYNNISWCNIIGRIAFPIFAFQLIQGYLHTKNLKNYFFRLFIFALISQVPYSLYFNSFSNKFELNIFFTLLLGLGIITLCNQIYKKNNYKFNIDIILVILAALFIAKALPFNYGILGLCLILIFYFFKDHKILMNILASISIIIYYLIILLPNFSLLYAIPYIATALISLCLINLYNNKEGIKTKIFYYIYPIHLLILYILYIILHN